MGAIRVIAAVAVRLLGLAIFLLGIAVGVAAFQQSLDLFSFLVSGVTIVVGMIVAGLAGLIVKEEEPAP